MAVHRLPPIIENALEVEFHREEARFEKGGRPFLFSLFEKQSFAKSCIDEIGIELMKICVRNWGINV
jgi:hypothetical protein